MRRIEIGVTAGLLILLIALHVTAYLESGGLWRDEVNSVNLSTVPSLRELWNKLQYDSFPIPWFLLLRAWVFVGLGETDLAIRALGLMIGVGTVAALFFAAWSLRVRLPVASFALFALSPTAFLCDTIRGYGLGVLSVLLAVGLMWRTVEDPAPRRMALGAAAVIVSVQCLYSNSALVFAVCVAAAAVGLTARDRTLTIFAAGAGLLAATSLVPYLGTIAGIDDWNVLFKRPVDVAWILGKLGQALAPAGGGAAWIWAVLCLLAVASLARRVFASDPDQARNQRRASLFVLTMMLVGAMSYVAFIKVLSYPTQSWHYLAIMAVVAVGIDKGIDVACEESVRLRIARVAVLVGIASLMSADAWNAVRTRKTNMDVLATQLQTLSTDGDLIVVFPFYYGVSFARYYRGSAAWLTIPEMDDHSVHRYDLFKSRMMEDDPLSPALEKMTRTLREGHRVWVVGGLDSPRRGQRPPVLPAAPTSRFGWSEVAYQSAWSQMAAFTLETHRASLERIDLGLDAPVNPHENVPLLVARGWRP